VFRTTLVIDAACPGGGSLQGPACCRPRMKPPRCASGGASYPRHRPAPLPASPACRAAPIHQAVQHKLATAHCGADRPRACALESAARFLKDLRLEEQLGRGGFGVCYRATYCGATVAVKVGPPRRRTACYLGAARTRPLVSHADAPTALLHALPPCPHPPQVLYPKTRQREAVKDAVEMAVLSHVRHPGVVSVYECFTELVEDCGGGGALVQALTGVDRGLPRGWAGSCGGLPLARRPCGGESPSAPCAAAHCTAARPRHSTPDTRARASLAPAGCVR
jgi:hypothetical protein